MATYQPIAADEARGDSPALSLGDLDKLADSGAVLLMSASHTAPNEPLTLEMVTTAWLATREPWGGVTVDLRTAQAVVRTDGYAVGLPGKVSVSPAAGYGEFAQAMFAAALKVASGQFLGVFYDLDENRIDIQPVFIADNADDAMAVGVLAHATGGAYDFATGDALWIAHLAEVNCYYHHGGNLPCPEQTSTGH